MLTYYKFREEIPDPVPARPTYAPRESGRGWPDECPPLRAANAFGWDVLASHDMVFRQRDGRWTIDDPVELETDWEYAPRAEEAAAETDAEGVPLRQRNAWFWDEDQVLPHAITKNVYREIDNQVKVSTFLFLSTGENELLYLTDIPNLRRPFRVVSALLETDWYPASYPWHCVLELDRGETTIELRRGEPLCRLFLVRRDAYFAREMAPEEFALFFHRTQEWLSRHGKGEREGMVDITGNYGKQQRPARFSVIV
jgi:hypothetical protein